jgi:hypothetical protein
MPEIKIDEKVPIPIIDERVPIPPKPAPIYPWKQMNVGDSFFVECSNIRRYVNFHSTASRAAKRNGIKLTLRREGSGIRVWRIT